MRIPEGDHRLFRHRGPRGDGGSRIDRTRFALHRLEPRVEDQPGQRGSAASTIPKNFTRVQKLHDGEYPTMFTPHQMNYWLNNSLYPARVMITLQKDLEAIGCAPQR